MKVPLRKVEVNRRNAKKSTRPRTARGKTISRYDALRQEKRRLSAHPSGSDIKKYETKPKAEGKEFQ